MFVLIVDKYTIYTPRYRRLWSTCTQNETKKTKSIIIIVTFIVWLPPQSGVKVANIVVNINTILYQYLYQLFILLAIFRWVWLVLVSFFLTFSNLYRFIQLHNNSENNETKPGFVRLLVYDGEVCITVTWDIGKSVKKVVSNIHKIVRGEKKGLFICYMCFAS